MTDPSNVSQTDVNLREVRETLRTIPHLLAATNDPGRIKEVRKTLRDLALKTRIDKTTYRQVQVQQRRAEYQMYNAIERGRREGWILTAGQRRDLDATRNVVSYREFVFGGDDYHQMKACGSHSPEVFEEALAQAIERQDVSRVSLIRILNAGTPAQLTTRSARADKIRNLASQGYASRQMVTELGVTEDTIRLIARDFGIEIPADRVLHGTHRNNNTAEAMDRALTGIEHMVSALSYLDVETADDQALVEWASRLDHLTTALNRFKKKIKEINR